MSCRRPAAAALVLATIAVIWTGCARQQVAKPTGAIRVAILPVDDQRGEAAETWPARVLPIAMSRQFANQEGVTVRTADSVSDALHAGATHLIHPRLNGTPAASELTVEMETVAGSKFERAGVIRAGTGVWLKAAVVAANLIKARVAPRAGELSPTGVSGEAAMTQLGLALALQGDPLDAVTGAHPDCGWCWEASAERRLNGGDRVAALEVVQRSRQALGVDEISRARLELLESGISGNPAMRAAALGKLARLTPSNIEVLTELASRATSEKQWDEAGRAWKRVLTIDPGSFDAMNQLGYIEAWQGHFDEAVKWHTAYEAADPAAANAGDSLGEVLLMAGRFDEADRAFASSYQKSPDFNAGAAMEKAALACWLRGDEAGARQRLDVFLKDRAGRGDPLVDWRRARWLYITGKADEATQLLETLRAQGTPPAKVFALASLALWSYEAGDRGAAATHLAGLAAITHPAAGRILPMVSAIVKPGSTQPAGKLFEGVAALLSSDDVKAIATLKGALQTAAPGDEWLARELLAWGYVRTGDMAAAGVLLRAGWPIPAALEGQITDFLVYPNLFYVRAKVASQNGDTAGAAKLFEVYVKFMGTRPDARHQKDTARKAVRL